MKKNLLILLTMFLLVSSSCEKKEEELTGFAKFIIDEWVTTISQGVTLELTITKNDYTLVGHSPLDPPHVYDTRTYSIQDVGGRDAITFTNWMNNGDRQFIVNWKEEYQNELTLVIPGSSGLLFKRITNN